jgi:predicted MFS family arabinose efflux permease
LVPRRLGTPFRWLLASSWVSNLGDGFALSAGPLLVAATTRDPRLVALATLLQRLPWLLFSMLAGALADRWSRVVLAATVDLARAAVLVLLGAALLGHWSSTALVLAVMFVLGTAEVFSNTSSATLLPALVAREDLVVANARLLTGYVTVFQLVGPPIGAVLFAAARPSPFLAQAALVALGALLITRIRAPRQATQNPDRHVAGEIAAGIRWAVRHAAVRTLLLTILIFNVTFGAAWSVLVLYAQARLHMGAVGFGLLTTASAVGGVAGTLGYGALTRRVSLGNLMRVGLLIETGTHLALALTTTPAVALAVMTVFGAHAFVWGTTSVTIRQRAVPLELQGRVSGVNSLASWGGIVIGSAVAGPIAARWGITAPFWFAFVGSALFVVLIWGQLRHLVHDAPVAALTVPT